MGIWLLCLILNNSGIIMKILITNYMETTFPGGINKVIVEVAEALSDKGHEITVIQPNLFDLPEEEIYKNFKIIRISSRIGNFYGLNIAAYSFMKKFLNKHEVDLIHVHGYHTLFSAEMVYLISNINPKLPIVFSPHFDIFSHNSFMGKHFWGSYNKFVGEKFCKKPILTLAASDFELNNINKILDIPKEKLKVIPHGINYMELNKEKNKDEHLNLLFVGYLLELKGVQYIFEALHQLIYKNNVKVCLRIVGEGPYKKSLKKIAKKLDIDNYILWEGFVKPSQLEKLREFYQKSDIFLLLSQSENYGIVVAEALSIGTPAIVTKRTALNDFLKEPGCFGVTYPPDPKEVADLILKIYENDIKIGPFSEKIRTWDEVVEDYERVYYNFSK
jgi:glycosyltransferase involved in cell wall biosynthesis